MTSTSSTSSWASCATCSRRTASSSSIRQPHASGWPRQDTPRSPLPPAVPPAASSSTFAEAFARAPRPPRIDADDNGLFPTNPHPPPGRCGPGRTPVPFFFRLRRNLPWRGRLRFFLLVVGGCGRAAASAGGGGVTTRQPRGTRRSGARRGGRRTPRRPALRPRRRSRPPSRALRRLRRRVRFCVMLCSPGVRLSRPSR